MISTTQEPAAPDTRPLSRTRAFTLVEVMISAALGGFLLTAILTAFLFLGRGGSSIQSYSEMEAQARYALETFAQDVRMAEDIVWHSPTSLTLTVPSTSGDTEYTYTYSSSAKSFTRQKTAPSTGVADTLITGIQKLEFFPYKINDNTDPMKLDGSIPLATVGNMTKQVQISLISNRTATTVATATNSVISARFILRNKRVTS